MNSQEYHDAAMRTAAGPEVFHWPEDIMIDKEASTDMLYDLVNYAFAAAKLDRWKSRIFYNKEKPVQYSDVFEALKGVWTPRVYDNPQFLHAILGIASEGGELVEDLLKFGDLSAGLGAHLDVAENTMREQGDIDWFQELLAEAIGISVDDTREINIKKLRKRFPDKFSEADAVERKDEVVILASGTAEVDTDQYAEKL